MSSPLGEEGARFDLTDVRPPRYHTAPVDGLTSFFVNNLFPGIRSESVSSGRNGNCRVSLVVSEVMGKTRRVPSPIDRLVGGGGGTGSGVRSAPATTSLCPDRRPSWETTITGYWWWRRRRCYIVKIFVFIIITIFFFRPLLSSITPIPVRCPAGILR